MVHDDTLRQSLGEAPHALNIPLMTDLRSQLPPARRTFLRGMAGSQQYCQVTSDVRHCRILAAWRLGIPDRLAECAAAGITRPCIKGCFSGDSNAHIMPPDRDLSEKGRRTPCREESLVRLHVHYGTESMLPSERLRRPEIKASQTLHSATLMTGQPC